MKVVLAQINLTIGDFKGNARRIADAYHAGVAQGADLVVTPELGICGYPPHDLVERPEMVTHCEEGLHELQALTAKTKTALAVGHVAENPTAAGRAHFNQVTVLNGGKRVFTQAKTLLPTYDVFDEARYFESAPKIQLWEYQGEKIALAICEDLWSRDGSLDRQLYTSDPIKEYKLLGATCVISLSASPFESKKWDRRLKLHQEAAREIGAPLLYLNQWGANDEILFDGRSFALKSDGTCVSELKSFADDTWVGEVSGRELKNGVGRPAAQISEMEQIASGLIVGIQDYFRKSRQTKAVIGLSGGIDSAVVAVLAVQALGAKNVLGVAMPSQYSSAHSLEDAEILARNLGVRLEVRPIKFMFSTAQREISDGRGGTLVPLAQENLQSRLRALILMTLSNHDGSLVLTTGNKSELATGYCTLYGDMVGAIAPIGDLYKTEVYELAGLLNQKFGKPIPERSITKAPSAELKPNQTDQDTLPPYEKLDALLRDYLEEQLSYTDLVAKYGGDWVGKTLQRVEANEYKRRQAVPVLKVSKKAFGMGRRIPVAKTWEQR